MYTYTCIRISHAHTHTHFCDAIGSSHAHDKRRRDQSKAPSSTTVGADEHTLVSCRKKICSFITVHTQPHTATVVGVLPCHSISGWRKVRNFCGYIQPCRYTRAHFTQVSQGEPRIAHDHFSSILKCVRVRSACVCVRIHLHTHMRCVSSVKIWVGECNRRVSLPHRLSMICVCMCVCAPNLFCVFVTTHVHVFFGWH